MIDPQFTEFKVSISKKSVPPSLASPFNYVPHELSLIACDQLQFELSNNENLEHNFGLIAGQNGAVIGKMFGVLVVETEEGKIGFLSAVSGKLTGNNMGLKLVPPVFDSETVAAFLNPGMEQLTVINMRVREIEGEKTDAALLESKRLKSKRKKLSNQLQNRLFDEYSFLNSSGKSKSLREIFIDWNNQIPPAAAGDCAAPKLFQYAFKNQMKPISLAEFWWGQSPKSDHWKHKQFYPACKEKCEPILSYMLDGINLEYED